MEEGTKVQNLIALERKLLLEEYTLLKMLDKIRDEKHKLEIEQLQLDHMIVQDDQRERIMLNHEDFPMAVDNGNHQSPADMDSAERVNKTELDLEVSSSLSRMMEGNFYADDMEDEEDEFDDDDNDDVGDYKYKTIEASELQL